MLEDALAEALAVLRATDALRTVLPPGSRDRHMIEAHMLVLDREIHALLAADPVDLQTEARRLREVSRGTEVRVGELQERRRLRADSQGHA